MKSRTELSPKKGPDVPKQAEVTRLFEVDAPGRVAVKGRRSRHPEGQ